MASACVPHQVAPVPGPKGGRESFKEYFEVVKKELVESAPGIKQRLNADVKYLAYPVRRNQSPGERADDEARLQGGADRGARKSPFFVSPYRVNRFHDLRHV